MDNLSDSKMNGQEKRSFGSDTFHTLTKHPFIVTAVLCFCCLTLTTGNHISFFSSIIVTVTVFVLGVCASIYIGKHDIKKNVKLISAILVIASAIVAFLFYIFVLSADAMPYLLLNAGLGIIVGIVMYLGITNRMTMDKIIVLLFAAGFLIRLVYVIYTPISSRQHDVSYFGSGSGHTGYIQYIYENFNVPDFDVRTVNQFYHPPFHHILAAIWLRIQTTFGIDFEYACENIQLLTLFYSSICMIISYKIFHQLHLKKSGLITATAIIVFCPTFFIMAGSINNDILSITFMLGAILNTIYWYKNQSFRYIIAIAFCVGFGMMTKLSVWMITPAIAFVFVYVFFKNIKSFKKYLLQFVSFGIICIPLGLWWAVRNFVKYDVPLTYVPKLSETSNQYVGDIPLLQRFFDFNPEQFIHIGDQFTFYGGAYSEYNPTIAFFKTSVFDELITTYVYPNIAGFDYVLFWSAVVLGLVGFVSMIYILIRKKDILDTPLKVFIFLIYAVMLVSYYVFCIQFPHVCTQNVRYAVPLIVIGAYFVGLTVQHFPLGKPCYRVVRYCILAVVVIFCVSSTMVYDIVAMSQV